MQKISKVFLAGGRGFLGQNVAKELSKKNIDFEVFDLVDGYDFRDFEKTKALFQSGQFDAVINCAAQVGGIQFVGERHGEIFYNNIIMSLNLMEAARLGGVKKFINPIPNCVYPAHLSLFKEEDLWAGPMHESVLSYAFAKKVGIVQAWSYKKQYGFEATNIIFPSMYGPFDHFDLVRSHVLGALIQKFVAAKKEAKPEVVIWGSGKPVRDWLYVEDGAEILVESLFMDSFVDPINVGQRDGVSVTELAKLVKDVVGFEGKIVSDTSKPDGAPTKVLDITKMSKTIKWKPKTDLKSGLKKTVEWYLKNL